MINKGSLGFTVAVILLISPFLIFNNNMKEVMAINGTGTLSNPYQISNVHELQNISKNLASNYILINDINASETRSWNNGDGFLPMGNWDFPFTGNFDGNSYNITNLFINRKELDGVGLFGCVKGNNILQNINIISCNITGKGSVSGFVATTTDPNSNITNIKITGLIKGNDYVGGLIGMNGCSVTSCHATCIIKGDSYIGGLIGYNEGVIRSCTSQCEVYGIKSTGCFIGFQFSNGIVDNCQAKGYVKGDFPVGGLIANNRGQVTQSSFDGDVYGTRNVGGLIGYNKNSVDQSFTNGSVTGTMSIIGGFIGYNIKDINSISVTDCYSNSNVKGGDTTGGFVGENQVKIENCYSKGSVKGNNFIGGFAGGNTGTIITSFWDTSSSGCQDSYGGIGKMSSELKKKSTFTSSGWDFVHCWCINDGRAYPFLRWQDIKPPVAIAGPDKTCEVCYPVEFDGTSSKDPFGIANYTWKFNDGLKDVFLYQKLSKFTFSRPGTYKVTLFVTDLIGNVGSDETVLTIIDTKKPIARAGRDAIIDEGQIVTFNGSASTDNVEIVNYTWSFVDHSEDIVLYGSCPSYLFEHPDVIVVTLNASDGSGLWGLDLVNVTIKDITAPIANAGEDQTIDEGTNFTFNGSESSDNDFISEYIWKFNDTTGKIVLKGISPFYIFNDPGSFNIELTVIDRTGLVGHDYMVLGVNDITPPIANAGVDIVIDQGSLANFDASKSSDNVVIMNYSWAFTEEYVNYILYGVSPSHKFTLPGTIIVTLTVTDNSSHSSKDTVNVIIKDTIPPTAIAGDDQTIALGSTAKFNGSSSTDNVRIVRYKWSFEYVGSKQDLYGASVSFKFDVPGDYDVTLFVYDIWNNTRSDHLIVHVINIGTVSGILVDEKGNPIGGAKVSIIGSDGKTYTTITSSNGSFSIEIPAGSFVWKISKVGYTEITGSSSVKALESGTMDLTSKPFKEIETEEKGSILPLVIIPSIIVILIIVGLVLFFIFRKKKIQDLKGLDKEIETSEIQEGNNPVPVSNPESPIPNSEGIQTEES